MASIIYVKKQDDLAKVVEKVITSPEEEVILVIPKNSTLSKSYFNFEILKREAKIAKKKIFIDSLDEIVRNFSKQAQIKLIDQTFEEKKQEIADILPPQKKEEKVEKKVTFNPVLDLINAFIMIVKPLISLIKFERKDLLHYFKKHYSPVDIWIYVLEGEGIAEGKTEIFRVYHIDRGYERLDEGLNRLGAQIERISV